MWAMANEGRWNNPRLQRFPFFLFPHVFTNQRSSSVSDTQQRIDALVKSHPIVLFMKGDANFPMCGFSGRAIQVLKAAGMDLHKLVTVNVLADEEIRQGIKDYSQWPTIPQLYVKGEFIGGSDIMMEMFESGELQNLLAENAA
jgi:monothiol glutaredoxin, grx4 family